MFHWLYIEKAEVTVAPSVSPENMPSVLLLTPFARLSQQYLLQSRKKQDLEMSLGPPDTNAMQILVYTTHTNQGKFSL